ncbi:uncharacterized protein PHACADRAFT_247205 [Phanerochaete carnosa HHB-10118-sp]|uniref:INO80 complex subunit B-like conserved region domain-containing protein n=1 Tax=Phanerochaete carnosa (strain HHB-10118-sp) TaxID=650164 RepID=K5WP20_PHACS|nr:uncharacterized protein PHACADRAFT_247205 [Phanerochaete carnosa HHB-10118-sp]EKM60959.1 hypothetical protein PHACADRAFT_247205 [Phanerochaete carnosa HHB-10118-sp]
MDVEGEQPTIETEEPEVAVDEEEEADELSDKEDELEDDEDEGSDVDVEAPDPGPSLPPRLRIKLKLPQQASEASSIAATATPTPDGTSRRRILSRGSDIESEDSDEDDGDSSEETTATPGRPLTARQAVLRNVVDSSHVSLAEPPNPRKKKPLTELEIALKREETARKRKNLSEKKLEDEKAETINRLLKKQSRARGRRNALSTAEDRPTPGAGNGQDDMEDAEDTASQIPVPPTMYRWVSTTKVPPVDGSDEKRMLMTFSVPVSMLSPPADDYIHPTRADPPPARPSCDVEGCMVQRKYRLVKDWQRGACSMAHLKALEAA